MVWIGRRRPSEGGHDGIDTDQVESQPETTGSTPACSSNKPLARVLEQAVQLFNGALFRHDHLAAAVHCSRSNSTSRSFSRELLINSVIRPARSGALAFLASANRSTVFGVEIVPDTLVR